MKKHTIKICFGRNLLPLILFYIWLPLLIFVLGWVRLYISIPLCLISILLLKSFYCSTNTNDRCIELNVVSLCSLALAVTAVGILMGWSGDFPQASDWSKHNAVLRDLIDKEWPVIYENDGESMLSYYIGQYIIPAVAGKISGSFRIAQITMSLWNSFGLLLIFLSILVIFGITRTSKILLCAFVFFSFNGLCLLYHILSSSPVLAIVQHNSFIGVLQYRSMFVCLRWVFAQCLVPWLIVILILIYRDSIAHYCTMAIPCMLYGVLPFVGLVFLLLPLAMASLAKCAKKALVLKQIFSWQNIICAISLGLLFFLYYFGNISGEKPEGIGLCMYIQSVDDFALYFVFIMFTVFPFAIYTRELLKKDLLYLINTLCLLIIPLFKMGYYNDFCMGVSIPSFFLLMLYVNKKLTTEALAIRNGSAIMVILLLFCAINPMTELTQTIIGKAENDTIMDDYYGSLENYASTEIDRTTFTREDEKSLPYNYFAYNLEENFFYNYISSR